MSSSPTSTATAPTGTSSGTGAGSTNSITGMSFVGSTPSTVLFFLAMAVGVAIALLFVFFTVRYFIRAKYGLHLYSASSRGMMFSPRATGNQNPVAYTDREIQEHLEYLRSHHFLRDDFLERRLYAFSDRRRRRRRRRGRFAKMKKLSPEEVQDLFPQCTYADWLSTGDDATSLSVEMARDESSDVSVNGKAETNSPAQKDTASAFDVVELTAPIASSSPHAQELDILSSSASSKGKTELHFDSGSCSICLEVFESSDIVRGLICGHVYHAECVDPWLTRRRACCPICKRDYYKEEGGASGNGELNIEEAEEAVRVEPGSADEGEPARTDSREAVAQEVMEPEGVEGGNSLQDGTRSQSPMDLGIEGSSRPHADADDSVRPQNAGPDSSPGETVVRDTEAVNSGPNPTPTEDTVEGEAETRSPIQDLNFDIIRSDPNIQALFNELVPLSERVRVLLDEFPDLNMETRAKEISKKMYGNVFKIIFWKLMGISKRDLYNWAVIKIYQEERASQAPTVEDTEGDQVGNRSTAPSIGQERASAELSRPGTPLIETANAVEMREIRQLDIVSVPRISAASSVYHMAEEDLAESARRREDIGNRV